MVGVEVRLGIGVVTRVVSVAVAVIKKAIPLSTTVSIAVPAIATLTVIKHS